jgi:hypothetical protein
MRGFGIGGIVENDGLEAGDCLWRAAKSLQGDPAALSGFQMRGVEP